ncbi:MAG: type IV pilus biogenesis/stability protein PilW [Gammaproteobacteria bacterium]
MSRTHTLVIMAILALGTAGCAAVPEQPGTRSLQAAAEANLQLGVGYLQQGNYELALEKLEKSLEQNPSSASAHNVIAVLYERLNQLDLAERHYRRALSLDPKDSGAHNNYGRFLCMRNRLAEAEKHFLTALENPLYQTPEIAHTNAGICALRVPDPAKAEQHFRSALKVNPLYREALIEMAKLSFEQERYLQARAYLQRYQEVAPKSAESLWLGVRIERALGNRDAAASYALLLKSNFPDSEEMQQLLESER